MTAPPDPSDPTPRKRQPSDEPDTYELNLEDEAPAAPARGKASPPRSPTKPGAGEGYDVAPPEKAKPSPEPVASKPKVPDPRLDTAAAPPAPPAPPAGAAEAAGSAAPAGETVPKQYQSEPEPAYLDPAVAASKREQARIRAAQQLAIEADKRRKIRLIALLAVTAAAVIAAGAVVLLG